MAARLRRRRPACPSPAIRRASAPSDPGTRSFKPEPCLPARGHLHANDAGSSSSVNDVALWRSRTRNRCSGISNGDEAGRSGNTGVSRKAGAPEGSGKDGVILLEYS